ncbi:Pls/PosA family non-ribosomal peptide synthetase [Streptomyces sp. CRN 30]|uniref:Pls/PosA family non-ribosomal peptide synthetase n=1 Tax=Streptomyces sp. CRN 30 TaxID=3075613 RepID=UPI002A81C354|nr:Pls/PosA family non-ribosomal peptide synthetase [Streptomyces sp. CRN 30]
MDRTDHAPTADAAGTVPAPGASAEPEAGLERLLAEVLAEAVGADRVSADSDFFDDLGADSLVMARFCARARKRDGLPSVSMKDIYRHRTVRSLARALTAPAPASVTPPSAAPVDLVPPARTSTAGYLFTGAAQLLAFLAYLYAGALVLGLGYDWVAAGSGLVATYLRAVLFGGGAFLGVCALPVAAKWILIGRWTPRRIRIWSPGYLRFWLVKTLVQLNPLVMFVGSPLYTLYLRALGARIGRGTLVLSTHVPVCTDLLTVGDGTVISKNVVLSGYRAHAGWVQTGPVTLGREVYVGEATVLDIRTSMGDGAELGHASSLHPGQSVPAGQSWHGSPAQRCTTEYRTVEPVRRTARDRFSFGAGQLLTTLLLYAPLTAGGVGLLTAGIPQLDAFTYTGALPVLSWTSLVAALLVSFAMYFGSLLGGLLLVSTLPRLLHLPLRVDRTYPLYGFHHSLYQAITRLTNAKKLVRLFGDSSAIVPYLRVLGWNLSRVEQTGSNFGSEVKQDDPYLSRVGTGTTVADGLSMLNADYSSSSFRLSRVEIGRNNFVGNGIVFPARSRTGDNVLLATKAMVPVDGPVRHDTGLLGSPPFEIPRTVERDTAFDHLRSGEELRRRLAAKNRHNAVTLISFLFARWMHAFVVLVLLRAAAGLYDVLGAVAIAAATALSLLFTIVFTVVCERAATGFRRQRPLNCSIYHPRFWRHERFWKHAVTELRLLNGTPFKGLWWRALGVRVGRRLFDDGCRMTERTLVTVGDDCTLNLGSALQCHSQEDGTFKSDRITVGDGCTIGVGALVHYGSSVGDGAVVAADSFLMKGEQVAPGTRWAGNPARELPVARPAGITVPG